MTLKHTQTELPGVVLIEPQVFKDGRGFFMETYHRGKYASTGIAVTFVQDNHSHSTRGTLRGLHYQLKNPQGKLVYVIKGEILDVAVDIRRGSPTFGVWVGAKLSDANRRQVFIPKGFAHGFSVLSDHADVIYKCTDFYAPGDEFGVLWNDPDLAIDWGVETPVLSEKDLANPLLSNIPSDLLPDYNGAEKPEPE